jgi:hypothetical protein
MTKTSFFKAIVSACQRQDERLKMYADKLPRTEAYDFMFPHQQECGKAQDDLRTKLGSASVTAEQAKIYIDDAVKTTSALATTCELKMRSRQQRIDDQKAADLDQQRLGRVKREFDEAQSRREEAGRQREAEKALTQACVIIHAATHEIEFANDERIVAQTAAGAGVAVGEQTSVTRYDC